ncbi:glycerol-3-phosphate dehydrogenase/oxidase [Thalassobacillus sp. CUG 92003]|uniref:glycerol-3-phosphate dehydrogenase/oxidase n=1 Tax=Thalassobacillus sp. CUG 92003 TaxID=2736641 RepID=UPI0015E78146|nr:FAD-dependent oxidoreductase [Thalassobacillus sp. CUG 92003]
MTRFSSFERSAMINDMREKELDVLIIGGGITGAGVALDAGSRGMTTGLLEMQDFAAGTSSRSTKLVHGGLRYLKQFEVKMVAEVGKEREIVYENGPHVTTPEWMMLPFHEGGNFGPFSTRIGLRVYDYLAGVKKKERRSMLSPKEALKREPLIRQKDLKGAGYYVEYKTDDARLTLEVLKKAVEYNVKAANYTKVIDFNYNEDNQLNAVVAEDQLTGETFTIFAKKIINAGGPWVDRLREIDGSKQGKTMHLTKGVHLVFDHKQFPLKQAVYFDSPDERMVFAIPRDGKTYVGTTDTNYEGDISHPTMTESDRDYILNAIADMFPDVNLTQDDVESSWAGLRPLIHEEGKDPSEISRKDEIFVSDSGLITIAGGKLTGYRKMAESVVDLVRDQFVNETGLKYMDSETKNMPISGGEVGGSTGFKDYILNQVKYGITLNVAEDKARQLVEMYGSNVERVFEIFQKQADEAEQAGIDPIVFAQLRYATEEEMITKPVDFFIRRTGALFFDIHWVHQHKANVVAYMAETLNWSDQQKRTYTRELEQLLQEAVEPIEYV